MASEPSQAALVKARSRLGTRPDIKVAGSIPGYFVEAAGGAAGRGISRLPALPEFQS